MGNWTTVKIEGSCSAEDLPALKKAVKTGDDWESFHCLSVTEGICGLGDWTGTEIDAVGNLAERDYSKDDVAEQLRKLVMVAPSLSVNIHVGGEWESRECVATVVCADGKVTIEPPAIQEIPEISAAQMHSALIAALYRSA